MGRGNERVHGQSINTALLVKGCGIVVETGRGTRSWHVAWHWSWTSMPSAVIELLADFAQRFRLAPCAARLPFHATFTVLHAFFPPTNASFAQLAPRHIGLSDDLGTLTIQAFNELVLNTQLVPSRVHAMAQAARKRHQQQISHNVCPATFESCSARTRVA
jgi:hypothetical protein